MNKLAFEEMKSMQENHWWFKGKRTIIRQLISLFVDKKNISLLEIGCGTGANLKMLAAFGEVTAVEMDQDAGKYAERYTGIKVLHGWLPDGLDCIRNKQFDVICMSDVLEHVKDDAEALKEIKKHLCDHGKLVITVPAYQWLFCEHDAHLSHYRRYSKKQLKKLLEEAGYNVCYAGYANTVLFPAMLAGRIIGQISSRHGVGYAVPCRLMNMILYKIFSFEAKILPIVKLPFGGSVIAVGEIHG